MEVNITQLHPGAIMPTYATDGSGCFDLYAVHGQEETYLFPGMPKFFDTGVVFEVPEGHTMLIFSRSGHGFRDGVRLVNSVGVLDQDFRDSLKVKLIRDTIEHETPVFVKGGDRIAQALIIPTPKIQFKWAEKLSDTVRGTGGLGHTGR